MTSTTPDETGRRAESESDSEGWTEPRPTETGLDETEQRLRAVLLGLSGGAFATLLMTLFRMPISDSLPPTANFLAKYLGGDPEDYPMSSFVLHFLYGIGGGGLFGLLVSERGGSTRAEIELRHIGFGIIYSLVFSLFGSRIVLKHVVGMDLERDEALIFHVGHAIYGVSLGTWIGSNF